MLHDPKRIQLVERWSRWLAWFYLFSGAIGFLIVLIAQLSNQNKATNYFSAIFDISWDQANILLSNLKLIVSTLATFLLFLGISTVIRFLRKYYAQITAGE